MARRTAVVICPGRGTYNKDELGYLGRHHADKRELIAGFDRRRAELGQETVSALDGSGKYSVSRFTRGDNASPLIYACAYSDFLSIDREKFDIVAVTGNSMGWYIALACAGALDADGGFEVVNTMGALMHQSLIGGQLLYPFVDENWTQIPGRKGELLALTESIPNLFISIILGGMIVFAGDDIALNAAEERLPKVEGRFPMRLVNHAAFHCPLQAPVAQMGRNSLASSLFGDPDLPLIDGRGQIWWPKASPVGELKEYTLGHQVVETYDFSAAVRTALREFAPEALIVTGPGMTLGGAVAQCLIGENWKGLTDKESFLQLQSEAPLLLAMGRSEQRIDVA
jgi:[acyl-carrier-protein] S-malonyltransferase